MPIWDQESNKRVILISGATSGIGLDAARTLAKNGCIVYAGERTPDSSDELTQLCSAFPNLVHKIQLDVANDDSV